VFSVPALIGLDLLLTLASLRTKSEAPSSSKSTDFTALKKETFTLHHRFTKWQSSLIPEFKPTIIGHIHIRKSESEIPPGYWPAKVETYFDHSVAGVWNIFRTARLLLLALIIKFSDGANDSCVDEYIHTAHLIVEDMLASVLYHLVENLQVFLRELKISKEINNPGRVLGGLLLMYPLYVTSRMRFLDTARREYMLRCLAWIGEYMGIGQATVLAKVRGSILTWTLFEPMADFLSNSRMKRLRGIIWQVGV
jgi:hypothetical protein